MPCLDMCVTSATELLPPRVPNLLMIGPNELIGHTQIVIGQIMVVRQRDRRLEPVLGLAVITVDVDVHARLLALEEEEPEAAFLQHRIAHDPSHLSATNTNFTWYTAGR